MASTVPQATANNYVTATAPQSSTASSQAQGSTGTTSPMDANAFLTMFVTQLKYQDPTNPLQSYELASQLAQFASVERLDQVNANLRMEQTYLASLNNAQMINLIGKEVVSQTDTIQLKDGKASTLQYTLEAPTDVTAKIYDKDNNLVRTINLGHQEANTYNVEWDGKDEAGNQIPEGQYTCKLEGLNADGKQVEVSTSLRGHVYSFLLEDGTPYLVLEEEGGVKLPVNTITEVI